MYDYDKLLLHYSKLLEEYSYFQTHKWAPGILMQPNGQGGEKGLCFLLQQDSHLLACDVRKHSRLCIIRTTYLFLFLVKRAKLFTDMPAACLERFSCSVLLKWGTGLKNRFLEFKWGGDGLYFNTEEGQVTCSTCSTTRGDHRHREGIGYTT